MPKIRRASAILMAFVAAAALSTTTRAQSPTPQLGDPGPDAARLLGIEAELRDEGRVRILGNFLDVEVAAPRAGSGGVAYGSVLRVHGSERTLPDTLAWADIRQIKVRRSSARKGGKTGAIVGVALAAVEIIGCAASDDCELNSPPAVVVGTTVFAGAGFAVGALIGAPFRHWKTVYSAYK